MAKIPCEYVGGVLVKVINKNFGSVTFNSGGEVAVSPPTTPSGYTLLMAIPFSYSGIPSGAISYMANYLQGEPNKTISIVIRYIYVKSENIETSIA